MIHSRRLCLLATLLIALSLLAFTDVPVVSADPGVDVLVYGGSGPQNEVSIAVNPLNSSNIVVGFNDNTGGAWGPGYAYSTNGGTSWTYGGKLPRGTLAGNPFCDPWLDFDRSGYLYYVALSDTPNHEIFVSVAAPNAQGMTGPLGFGNPQIVESGTRPNDKPAIAVDKTGGSYDGNVYVVWARNSVGTVGANGYRMFFRRGRRTSGTAMTWDPAQQVGPDTFTQGAQVAVGPNGQVYVAYQRQTSANIPTANAQLFSYSTDGGSTFTKNIFVSSITPPNWDVSPDSWARHQSFPTLGVSPTTGTIFIAWCDRRNGDDDILLSRSTDGGTTWLPTPKRVNTDTLGNGKDQWHPALTVNSVGHLDVAFYDRRNDPNNKLTMLYGARSKNEGDSFTNWAISDTATNPDAFLYWASGSVGDYIGIDSQGSWTYVSWGDGRNGNISPRDYNSDVYFDKFLDILIKFRPLLLFPLRLISRVPPTLQPMKMNITVLPIDGFNGTVKLRAEKVPSGAYAYFTPDTGVPPFTSIFTLVSEYAEEGTYEVMILGYYDKETTTKLLNVTITSKPYILLETMTANPGQIITFEGNGFTANSSYDVFLDGKLLKTDEAGAQGMIFSELKLPGDTPDGEHTVEVRDAEGITASAKVATPIIQTEKEKGKPPVGGIVIPTQNIIKSVEPLPSWAFLFSIIGTVTTVSIIVKKRKRLHH